MEIFGWLEEMNMRGQWRSALMEFGALCVMTLGIKTKPEWHADSLDLMHQVSLQAAEKSSTPRHTTQ